MAEKVLGGPWWLPPLATDKVHFTTRGGRGEAFPASRRTRWDCVVTGVPLVYVLVWLREDGQRISGGQGAATDLSHLLATTVSLTVQPLPPLS